jgi:hypothetical protein
MLNCLREELQFATFGKQATLSNIETKAQMLGGT